MLELLITLPFLLVYVTITGVQGTSSYLSIDLRHWIFIFLAGMVTVIPLILFGNGAKQIPLSSLGILQYIAPSLMLIIGVVIYGEPFTVTHLISFTIIWCAVILYMVSLFMESKKQR